MKFSCTIVNTVIENVKMLFKNLFPLKNQGKNALLSMNSVPDIKTILTNQTAQKSDSCALFVAQARICNVHI